jgi:hypothetical protein
MDLEEMEAAVGLLLTELEDAPTDLYAMQQQVQQLLHQYEAMGQTPPDDLMALSLDLGAALAAPAEEPNPAL